MNSSTTSAPTTFLTRQSKGKRGLTTFIVASIAAIGAIAALMMCGSNENASDVKFFGDSLYSEKQQAFMSFLATYGRSYASKDDVNHRFDTFSANYDKIKEHNDNNLHFKMAIN